MQDNNIPPADADEFSRAFNLYVRLDEAKATATRLRAAADRTTGLECEANIRLAEAAKAEVARIETELGGEGHPEEDAGPAGAEPTPAPAVEAHEGKPPKSRTVTRQRHDDLALELERVLALLRKEGRGTSPHAVMDVLRAHAGRPESCIAASVPEGVTWTRGMGKVEVLTTQALAKRIKRM